MPQLTALARTRSVGKIANILNELPNSGISALCECIYNALYSKSLSRKSVERLRKLNPKVKDNVRQIVYAPKNGDFKNKRQLLKQSGGSLGTIISSVLPLLLSFI